MINKLFEFDVTQSYYKIITLNVFAPKINYITAIDFIIINNIPIHNYFLKITEFDVVYQSQKNNLMYKGFVKYSNLLKYVNKSKLTFFIFTQNFIFMLNKQI